MPCLFPFKYHEVTAYGCLEYNRDGIYEVDEKQPQKVKKKLSITLNIEYKHLALVLYKGR